MHYSGGTGWDIEDLVRIGRRLQGCPYYASRDLMGEAQIIFCPYNYLIDPRVRRSMKIPIQNNIIILVSFTSILFNRIYFMSTKILNVILG